jgi:hypothetical protein
MRGPRFVAVFGALAITCLALAAVPAGASGTRTVSLSTPATQIVEGSPAVVTVSLTGAPATSDVIVNLHTIDGSAKAGTDYMALNTSVRFHPGDQSPKTVTIPTYDDHLTEGPETFSVTMDNVRNAATATTSLTFLLLSDVPPAPFSCTVWQSNRIDWEFPPVTGAVNYAMSVTANGHTFSITIPASQVAPDPAGTGDLAYSTNVDITATFGTATSFMGHVDGLFPEDYGVHSNAQCGYTTLPII